MLQVDDATWDEHVERARSLIGVPLPMRSRSWVEVADASSIEHFALGYGDDNPLWSGRSATASRWGSPLAPPLYLIAAGIDVAPPLEPHRHGALRGLYRGATKIMTGAEWRWFRPVIPGDRILCERFKREVEVRSSGFGGGRAVSEVVRTLYADSIGDPIALQDETYLYTRSSGSRSAGRYAAIERATYTPEQIAEIDHRYSSEARRGSEARFWEDVAVGSDMPALAKGPLCVTDVIGMHMGMGWLGNTGLGPLRAAALLRSRAPAMFSLDEHGVPDTVQRVHWDEAAARAAGLPAPYDYGQMRTCWLSQVVTDWMGDDAWLDRLDTRMKSFNFLGDLQTCTASVVATGLEEGRHTVELRLEATNQRGTTTACGSATVALASRAAGPVLLPPADADVRRRAARMAVASRSKGAACA